MIGLERSRRTEFTSGLWIRCSVEVVTFVTTEEIEVMWVLMVERSASARILATRD